MVMVLLRSLIFLLSAGLGLIAADLILDDFAISWSEWWGFVICIVIFAVLQSVLSPWIAKMADRYAPVLVGGIGIISTLIALVVVVLLPIDGLHIRGAAGWLLGAVIVWLVTAIASALLPMLFIKRKVAERRADKN